MAQLLIVEGNDAIALSNLLIKRNLAPPRGYAEPKKFIDEFVKSAGGFQKALVALEESLENSDLTNIGLIVDADEAGVVARWEAIKSIIVEQRGEKITIDSAAPSESGIVLREADKLTIGIWIMPDNHSKGYLEHFLSNLIDQNDPLWLNAKFSITQLEANNLRKFSPVKGQKALLHTWLAWQEDPGKPFGIAIQAGFLNATAPAANHFENWFRATFELSN